MEDKKEKKIRQHAADSAEVVERFCESLGQEGEGYLLPIALKIAGEDPALSAGLALKRVSGEDAIDRDEAWDLVRLLGALGQACFGEGADPGVEARDLAERLVDAACGRAAEETPGAEGTLDILDAAAPFPSGERWAEKRGELVEARLAELEGALSDAGLSTAVRAKALLAYARFCRRYAAGGGAHPSGEAALAEASALLRRHCARAVRGEWADALRGIAGEALMGDGSIPLGIETEQDAGERARWALGLTFPKSAGRAAATLLGSIAAQCEEAGSPDELVVELCDAAAGLCPLHAFNVGARRRKVRCLERMSMYDEAVGEMLAGVSTQLERFNAGPWTREGAFALCKAAQAAADYVEEHLDAVSPEVAQDALADSLCVLAAYTAPSAVSQAQIELAAATTRCADALAGVCARRCAQAPSA